MSVGHLITLAFVFEFGKFTRTGNVAFTLIPNLPNVWGEG
jgi:hypothetical protein